MRILIRHHLNVVEVKLNLSGEHIAVDLSDSFGCFCLICRSILQIRVMQMLALLSLCHEYSMVQRAVVR